MCSSRGLEAEIRDGAKNDSSDDHYRLQQAWACATNHARPTVSLCSLSLCSFHACVHPSELLSLRFSVAPLISEAFLFPHYFVASLSLTNYSNPLFSVLTCTFSL